MLEETVPGELSQNASTLSKAQAFSTDHSLTESSEHKAFTLRLSLLWTHTSESEAFT
ncbi:MAG: hypothetical protein ABEJ87_03280 [Candidatus Nanohalobium sp.]